MVPEDPSRNMTQVATNLLNSMLSFSPPIHLGIYSLNLQGLGELKKEKGDQSGEIVKWYRNEISTVSISQSVQRDYSDPV